jgi:hypothetical protein
MNSEDRGTERGSHSADDRWLRRYLATVFDAGERQERVPAGSCGDAIGLAPCKSWMEWRTKSREGG